jgi:hypothetical protein
MYKRDNIIKIYDDKKAFYTYNDIEKIMNLNSTICRSKTDNSKIHYEKTDSIFTLSLKPQIPESRTNFESFTLWADKDGRQYPIPNDMIVAITLENEAVDGYYEIEFGIVSKYIDAPTCNMVPTNSVQYQGADDYEEAKKESQTNIHKKDMVPGRVYKSNNIAGIYLGKVKYIHALKTHGGVLEDHEENDAWFILSYCNNKTIQNLKDDLDKEIDQNLPGKYSSLEYNSFSRTIFAR